LPADPFEAAKIDGASHWQVFRHVTWPLLLPYVAVAAIIRTIDALKAFDTIFVITQGGPGTASETINIFLYLNAFAYYELGYSSAVVLVFFVLIIVLSLVMLAWRQRLAEATK
ncbi:MAG: sugar ABC transporter permease, partial [Acetobacteraceae bacterium]|nr:sugar ABC transporter permease [Acetobacteraceae bacterium]